MSNYWIGEKCNEDLTVIQVNNQYSIGENVPDDMNLREYLKGIENISPNINERLPNKAYNPSMVHIGEGYVVLSKVTSFSKCNETREKSNEIYEKNPIDHSSNIVLTFIPTSYNWKEVIDKNNIRSILLDIPITDDFIPKQKPFVPGYEDPRPFIHDNALWFMCNARLNSSFGKARMFLVYVCELDQITKLKEKRRCTSYKLESEYINPLKDEKNWSPWWSNYSLKVTYSIYPHKVLDIPVPQREIRISSTGIKRLKTIPVKIEETKPLKVNCSILDTIVKNNDFSILRCSTQGITFSYGNYGHTTLAFGHIRDGERYWIFPYLFKYEDNYRMLEIGEPKEILGDKTQCYVSGLTSTNEGNIYLTFGVNDCHAGSIKLTRSQVSDWLSSSIFSTY